MKLENPTVLSIDDSDFCRLLSSVLSKEILQAYGVGLTVVSAEFDEDDIRWNISLEWGADDE